MSDDNLAMLRELLSVAAADGNENAARALDIVDRSVAGEPVSDEERAFVLQLFDEEN